ncbi:hypothetical protein ILUMI_01224 [Ignelater luminosus]|uniref:Uncharacterized protein n=1 Tax=Ignelater luminosus TaxID=2038154 RepID=A0A8K0DF09_IGNLU|nr:hypothetical protein ILUMI_01224 [Ignelater luminosus]
MEDFQYVVERKKPDPICFGSRVVRDTNPIGKALSAFQKRYAYEAFSKVSPQTYHTEKITSGVSRLQNKMRSNKGVGGLANGAPRFPQQVRFHIPSPTRYNPEPKKKTKQMKAPFGNSISRESESPSRAPGAGNYDISGKRCRRTRTAYNFGRPTMISAVETLCIPVSSDRCDRCNTICDHDYWHKNYTSFLCHFCMEEEKILHEDYTQKELKEYQVITFENL